MIPRQPFGRTGHDSTRTIFGAAALWNASSEQAARALDLLLEYGINHIDTAASYGRSEDVIGPWMEQHRDDFFLATKTGERGYEQARDEIHRSLERLRVSNVDLLQLHNLAEPDEWEIAMGPGGALDAAIEAREQGLVRFIGVTGHGTGIAAMHLRSLERFDFDSVLLPYSYVMMQNAQYAADFEALMTVCEARDVAVQTIKGVTRRPWAEGEKSRNTWYEPLEEPGALDRAVHWVLSRPNVFLNTLGDLDLLPEVFDAASRFEQSPSDEAMREDMEQLEMAPLFV